MNRTRFAIRCAFLFAIAFLVVMPDFLLAKEVVPMGLLLSEHSSGAKTYKTLYTKAFRESWLAPAPQVYLAIMSLIKGPALITTVFIVDMIVILKFQNHLKKKRAMTKSKLSSSCLIKYSFEID